MLLGILNKGIKHLLNQLKFQVLERNKGSSKQDNSPKILPVLEDISQHPSQLQMIAKRYEGKFLLRDEIPLRNDLFQQLLLRQYFIPVPTIQQSLFHNRCTRCHNKDAVYFAAIACSRCNQSHLYCRKCIHMGRILACESLYYWYGPSYDWPRITTPCTWEGTLTYAQEQAAIKMKSIIIEKKSLIIWAVTGAGKTEMLFPGITHALEQGMRICIASPRADVVRELLPRLQKAFRSIHIQGLYSGSRDNDGTAQLIISTTHQLLRYKDAFDLLIIDEIDAFPYHQDRTLQMAANRAKRQHSAVVHLTATPRRIQHEQMAANKIESIFVPVRFHGHPLIEPSWILDPGLKGRLEKSLVPESFKKWLAARTNPSRQLLIFVPTIQLARKMEDSLANVLLKAGLIQYKNEITNVHAEDHDRQQKINLFRERQLYSLVTTTILERGVTFPSIDVAVLHAGHQVFDEAALIQITGRAGRSPVDPLGHVCFFHDGKTEAIVKANREIAKMNKRREKMIARGKGNI